MNNQQPNMFSTIEQNIHNIISETIQNYISGNSSHTNSNETSSNNMNQQIITILREIVRLGNRNLENYNRMMIEHSRNTRELTIVLNRLIDITNVTPIDRQRNIYNNAIFNRQSRTQPRVQSRTQSRTQPRATRLRQPNTRQPRTTTTFSAPTEINNIFSHRLFPVINANNFSNLFENVPVFPTPAELENASETIFYDVSMELINNRCPITLATFQPGDRLRRILYCHHTFTEDAFIRWFQENVCCPVCRFHVRTYESSSVNNENNEDNEDNEDENNEDNEDENNENNEDENNENNEDENNDSIDHGYITPIGTTTESFTITDASTNNNIGSYSIPPTSNLNSTIESMIQSAIIDSSSNIVNNLTQYLTTLPNVDSSNNTQHPFVSLQMYAMDASNNSLPL